MSTQTFTEAFRNFSERLLCLLLKLTLVFTVIALALRFQVREPQIQKLKRICWITTVPTQHVILLYERTQLFLSALGK